ncbi:ATP-binding protein, partial [bacterium]|nr:ATP-binding protein [bacterium]
FLLVLLVTHIYSRRNERLLNEIETRVLPAMELSRALESILTDIQNALKDAAAIVDESELAVADSHVDEFIVRLHLGRKNNIIEANEYNELRRKFVDFYTFSRETTERMIRNETGEHLTGRLEVMTSKYNNIKATLELNTVGVRNRIHEFFVTAKKNQLKSIATMSAVILLCTVLIVGLSFIINRIITTPLSEAVRMANRISRGDYAARIGVNTEDEIGLLSSAFSRMARKIKHSIEKLESTNQELREFAYIVSHDLKAPLRAIGSLADWIAEDYTDKFDEDGKEQMNLLVGRVRRMDALINGILQYSRIGRVQEKKKKLDLNRLVEDAIDLISPPENFKVQVENMLPTIVSDETRMHQVFQNLISNAIKYMDKPEGEVKIGCFEDNGFWRFHVADNGPGIDEKYHDRIFKIFQTLTARDQRESTGVGLSVVKKIIETYNGQIWVESKVGCGSTFFFSLPRN